MNDERLLLRAVCASAAEDTPRLMYADWCEENGRPERAELIRVQVGLASCGKPHKRTAYPDEPVPLKALGDKHYRFGAYADDGFEVGDRVDLLVQRPGKRSKHVHGFRVYMIRPQPEAHARGEVEVFVRLDADSGPWAGESLKARERVILGGLQHFSVVLRGWSVHDNLFARTTGVVAPPGYEMSIALFDATGGGRACLNFSFSRDRVKATGDMRLYFDRGFGCEWWCPLLDFREHARFVFGAHPVDAVRFTDREPTRYMNETEPDVWRSLPCEWSDFQSHGQLSGWLPRDVCPIGGFDSLAAAESAVSERAVAHGRELAGLSTGLERSAA